MSRRRARLRTDHEEREGGDGDGRRGPQPDRDRERRAGKGNGRAVATRQWVPKIWSTYILGGPRGEREGGTLPSQSCDYRVHPLGSKDHPASPPRDVIHRYERAGVRLSPISRCAVKSPSEYPRL